ncbi:MAG: DNA-processing protein DprA [Clostridia bacterium]|nr:DNA-processing protein DprA [Clostridia bacterium]
MTIEDKNILWLDLFDFLSYGKKTKLLEAINKGESLREKFLTVAKIKEILTSQEYSKMALCLSDEFLNRHISSYQKDNIETVTFYNPNYPFILKEISSPPLCLYCKGDITLLNSFCVGVVGTRTPTDYGIQVTKQYCKALANVQVTVVSGMATGIDSVAHKTALENNGKTIAVLAGGLNHIYPATNYNLANTLMENNLIITEYPPNTKPLSYYFPVRNRIIAGLSKGVLVPEMGEKSGAMHTINYALEFNRDIFVVPGRINSPMSKGANKLIKNLQGCITISPEDILDCYHLNKTQEKNNIKQLDINSQMILNFIESEKHTYQEILDFTKLSANELNTLLIMLEMEGLLIKLANNSYIMA